MLGQFVTIALIAITALVASQQTTLPPRGTGVIAGRIVEGDSTRGVAGATVTLAGPTGVTPPQSRRVVATADGGFLFRDLVPGNHSITANANGFFEGSYGRPKPTQVAPAFNPPRSFQLEDGEVVTNLTIPIWRLGGISGMVVDEHGEPMVAVELRVFSRVADWAGVVMQQAEIVSTDDRGMYHVDVVPGDYIVGALVATTTIPVSTIDALQASSLDGTAMPELRANQAPDFGRTIGTRWNGFYFSWSNRNAGLSPGFGDDGRLTLYPTTFYPQAPNAAAATVLSIKSGEERSGVDLRLRQLVARRVSGRVVGPAGAVANIGVRLVAVDPANDRTNPPPMLETYAGMTDGSGNFTLLGIRPGQYTARVLRTGAKTLSAAEPVVVGDTNVDSLVIVLSGGGTFSGRVIFEGQTAPPAAAQRSIAITPRALAGSKAAMLSVTTPAFLDPAGGFASQEFPAGPYVINVSGLPAGWILKSAMLGTTDAADTAVGLAADGIRNLVVTLTDRISVLAGTVRDGEGRAAADALIAVFPVDRVLWRKPGMTSRRSQVAVPGRNGEYRFRGLPAGEYFVVATRGEAVDFSDPKMLTSLIPDASRVVLTDGSSKSVDVRVVVRR